MSRRETRWLIVFLAGVFILKTAVALQLGAHPLLQPDTGLDTTAYVDLAKRVAAGDLGLGPGLYPLSPLYIYFLAAIYAVTKSLTAARVIQAALGTVAVALTFAIARRWFSPRSAWLAAFLSAMTGIFTFYEGLLLQTALDPFLAALALWLLSLALHRRKAHLFILAGAALGVAALNRPNMLVAGAAIALVLVAIRRMKDGMLIAAGLLAGVAPVTIRNVLVAHQWSLISSHGGINFYIGNGDGATGYFHAIPGMRSTLEGLEADAKLAAERAKGRTLTDAEVSSYYTSLTWKAIGEHPARWGWLLVRKSYRMFNASHASTPFSYTFYAYDAGTLLRFCIIGGWLLIPLGVFGLVRAAPRWDSAYIAWLAFVPSYAASVILFFITERYKVPLFIPLAAGAGAALDLLITDFQRQPRRFASRFFFIAPLFIAANWPLHLDDDRGEERIRMAEYRANQGEISEAERWTQLALERYPDAAAVHFRVGAQFVNSRNAAPAIEHLTRAAQLRPNDPRTEYVLGRALLGGGRAAEAAAYFRQAISHGVDAPLAGYDLSVALEQSGDIPGAAQALRDMKPPPDTAVDTWLTLGKQAGEVRAPDLAESFFRQAVAIAPNHARAHHLHGLAFLVMQRYGEAAEELSVAVRLEPGNSDAFATLAYCEQRLGKIDEARRHAAAALTLDPSNSVAKRVLTAR